MFPCLCLDRKKFDKARLLSAPRLERLKFVLHERFADRACALCRAYRAAFEKSLWIRPVSNRYATHPRPHGKACRNVPRQCLQSTCPVHSVPLPACRCGGCSGCCKRNRKARPVEEVFAKRHYPGAAQPFAPPTRFARGIRKEPRVFLS